MDNHEAEFSVYQFFVDDSYERVRQFVPMEEAVKTAIGYSTNPAAKVLGTTVRVIITDGGDCTVWEWKRGQGIVWPEELKGQLK